MSFGVWFNTEIINYILVIVKERPVTQFFPFILL